jgi:hypothetical protein
MGTRPTPDASTPSDFPITAPKARAGSVAFMAWPRIPEVVSRSPTSTACWPASTLQYTLPTRAMGGPARHRRGSVQDDPGPVAAGPLR